MAHLCAHAKEGIQVILTKLMNISSVALSSTDLITYLTTGLQWATHNHLLFTVIS